MAWNRSAYIGTRTGYFFYDAPDATEMNIRGIYQPVTNQWFPQLPCLVFGLGVFFGFISPLLHPMGWLMIHDPNRLDYIYRRFSWSNVNIGFKVSKSTVIYIYIYIYIYIPPGRTFAQRFIGGLAALWLICSGYVADCFRVCLGLV